MMRQKTIKVPFSFQGVGVHTGGRSRVTVHPASEDEGILFRRVDLPGHPEVKADPRHVVSTDRCTVVGAGSATVSTVEHLMAALYGAGIDNCIIDVDGGEIPIMDGSSASFYAMVVEAGVRPQGAARRFVTLTAPVALYDGPSTMVALPYDTLRLSVTFTNDHAHPKLADMHGDFVVDGDAFPRHIAPARTMGWLKEVEALQARGLLGGANMDVAVVFSDDDVLTPMRFPDEPMRHKALDLIGDLFLLGRVQAHIMAIRPGHRVNNALARAIGSAVTTTDGHPST